VRTMRELEYLNVINLCDGKILGRICDMDIETDCGRVTAIIIKPEKGIFCWTDETIRICWEQIRCIGEDTILVEYKREANSGKNHQNRKYGGFLSCFNCK